MDLQDNAWRYLADGITDLEEARDRSEVRADAMMMRQLQQQMGPKAPAPADFWDTHVKETVSGGVGGGELDLGPTQAGEALPEAPCLAEGVALPAGSAPGYNVDLSSEDEHIAPSFSPAALTERRTGGVGTPTLDLSRRPAHCANFGPRTFFRARACDRRHECTRTRNFGFT